MAFERSKMTLNTVGNYVGSAASLLEAEYDAEAHENLHIVDQLIAERGGALSRSVLWPVIKPLLHRVLHYHEAVSMADEVATMSAADCLRRISRRLKLDVTTSGLENIPAQGGFILVCNHPTGIADGIAMWDALAHKRPDMAVFANRDAIRVNRHLKGTIIPVEWREGHKPRDKSRETLRLTTDAIKNDKGIVVFPSGRIAYWDDGGLVERPWQTSAVMLARKYNLPVVPANMSSRNSGLFYWFANWSTELRDMTVFHELLNKQNTPFEVTFGDVIDPQILEGDIQTITDNLQAFCTRTLAKDPKARF